MIKKESTANFPRRNNGLTVTVVYAILDLNEKRSDEESILYKCLTEKVPAGYKVCIAERGRTEERGRWLPSSAPSLPQAGKAATGSACYSGQGY